MLLVMELDIGIIIIIYNKLFLWKKHIKLLQKLLDMIGKNIEKYIVKKQIALLMCERKLYGENLFSKKYKKY